MLPDDQVVQATTMTPNALYYGEPGWLEHKFVVYGKHSHRTDPEQAEKTAALRQLFRRRKSASSR